MGGVSGSVLDALVEVCGHLGSRWEVNTSAEIINNIQEFIDSITLDSIGSTNEEPGCLRFDVYQNLNDPTELYLYEVYSNADAFEYHRGTPHIKKWQETVKDMYDESRKGQNGRRGKNIWPPDNWEWNSGQRK